MQLMTLVAMEKPVSNHPDDIRDEKVKVLRCTKPIEDEDCVIGHAPLQLGPQNRARECLMCRSVQCKW